MWQQTIALVNEDALFPKSQDYSALFFNRSRQSLPGQSFTLWRPSPPWTFFADPFVSVYPVIEAYQQVSTTLTSTTANVIFNRLSTRLAEPEDEYSRFAHGVYFTIVRRYVAQLVGYTFEQPDFCDHPWLEWVHPGQSPESALFAFRGPGIPLRGQQFNLFFNQPKPWPVEREEDSVFRKPDVGVLLPFGRPMPVPITMPDLLGLTESQAVAVVITAGLVVGEIVFEDTVYPVQPITRGTVIGQWPLPGATVVLNFPVLIILSSGLMYIPGVQVSVDNPVVTVIGSIVPP